VRELNKPPTRARARGGLIMVEFRGFRSARSPQGMLKNVRILCSAAYQEAASVARHRRQRCASRRAPMGAVDERIHRGAGSGASTDVLRDWRPAPPPRHGAFHSTVE